jgi:CubicO group peptidase (beta-lactamase class C family)
MTVVPSEGVEPKVEGFTEIGFESVAPALARAVEQRQEEGCAVSAYVDGHKVVDLWAGTTDGRPWAEDTLALMFSCSKGALALCAQILFDRGLLDLDAPVSTYWPEFAASGKDGVTVLHMLTHTAGVVSFPYYWKDLGMDCLRLADWELMTTRFAESPPSWPAGTHCFYHSLSIGYVVGEIIRRIDGRSPGRFFAEEVAGPLGLDMYIGTPDEVLPRAARIQPEPPRDFDKLTGEQLQLARLVQQMTEIAHAAVRSGTGIEIEALLWSANFMHPDIESPEGYLPSLFNSPVIRRAEIPAGNAIGGARDLARMYAVLANGGAVDGVRLVGPESIERFNTPESTMMAGLPEICVGYHRLDPLFLEASEAAFGHGGAGGSMGFADPERGVSFGFVKSRMTNEPGGSAADLASAVYACL